MICYFKIFSSKELDVFKIILREEYLTLSIFNVNFFHDSEFLSTSQNINTSILSCY